MSERRPLLCVIDRCIPLCEISLGNNLQLGSLCFRLFLGDDFLALISELVCAFASLHNIFFNLFCCGKWYFQQQNTEEKVILFFTISLGCIFGLFFYFFYKVLYYLKIKYYIRRLHNKMHTADNSSSNHERKNIARLQIKRSCQSTMVMGRQSEDPYATHVV